MAEGPDNDNYATIVFFVDMLVIAVAALENTVGWASGVAMLVFLIGVALTAVGVFISTLEIRTSQVAVEHDLSWLAQHRYHSGVAADQLQPGGNAI
jgi:hypothetical protein